MPNTQARMLKIDFDLLLQQWSVFPYSFMRSQAASSSYLFVYLKLLYKRCLFCFLPEAYEVVRGRVFFPDRQNADNMHWEPTDFAESNPTKSTFLLADLTKQRVVVCLKKMVSWWRSPWWERQRNTSSKVLCPFRDSCLCWAAAYINSSYGVFGKYQRFAVTTLSFL